MESSSEEPVFQEIINERASARVLQLLCSQDLGKEDLNVKTSVLYQYLRHSARGRPAGT